MTPALRQLVQQVADKFRLEVEDVLRTGINGRSRRAALAAGAVMYIIRVTWEPRPGYAETARMLGRKDASSAKGSIGVIDRHIKRGTPVGRLVQELLRPASVPPPKLQAVSD